MAILVIENGTADIASVLTHLANLGYETVVGTMSDDATLAREADAVICPFSLENIAKIRAQAELVPILVIASELPQSRDMLTAFRVGATDFVSGRMDDGSLSERLDVSIQRAQDTARDNRFLADVERDQRAGRQVQRSLLPQTPWTAGEYRFAHEILPSLLLSGDFVDYMQITDSQAAFYLVDVAGHGASSAFITVVLRNLARTIMRDIQPRAGVSTPGRMLTRINRGMHELDIDKHATMFLGIIDLRTNMVSYANAGHYPCPIVVAGGESQFLEITGKPIGLFEDVAYRTNKFMMRPGDHLIVQSDGVLESMQETTLEAKESTLLRAACVCAPDIEALWREVGAAVDAPGPDDTTCMVISRRVP